MYKLTIKIVNFMFMVHIIQKRNPVIRVQQLIEQLRTSSLTLLCR